jgi:hypothetical protein
MSTALHQVKDVIRKVHDAAGIPRSLRSARRCRIDRLERHGCLLKSRHLRQNRTPAPSIPLRRRYRAGDWLTVAGPWPITPQAIRLPAFPAGSVM